ncbi:MAG: 1-acyl-sn-glycerol-3-phosphate acyltransferase [Salibacteraceae bacterium]
MIYHFLKRLYALTFKSYFKVLKVTGLENIPSGPIIFVANHPSTLMDPIVIATLLRKKIYFLAAAEFMGKGLVTKFMQSFLNMIPVYRPDTLPGEAKKNADVFFKCFEHLGNDGAILIFPEGSSKTQRKLRPIKTGAVRIALGAQKDNGKMVNIVPIGLNYSNPHQFRSECFVSVGKPINVESEELKDCEDDNLAIKFTELVESKLRENVIHLEDESVFELFEKIKKIVLHEQQNMEGKTPSQKSQFALGQHIQDALTYFSNTKPEEVQKLNEKLDAYIERVEFYNVTDASISKGNPKVTWGDYLKILLGLPFYLLGMACNALPYYLTTLAFRKMKVGHQFVGSIILNIGLILFLLWYVVVGVATANLFNEWWLGIVAVLIMYLSGKFTLRYIPLINFWKQQGNWSRVLKRDRNIFESLKADRAAIIDKIMAYHKQYDEKQ